MNISIEMLTLAVIMLTIFIAIVGFIISRQNKLLTNLHNLQSVMRTKDKKELSKLREVNKKSVDAIHKNINQRIDVIYKRVDIINNPDQLEDDVKDLKRWKM